MTELKESNCPYAVALHEHEHEESDSSVDGGDLIKKCPAFESGSCPFKDTKSPEQVRQTLLTIPKSHFDETGKFYKVVRELHNVHLDSTTKGDYHLPGGCPVQPVVEKAADEHVSFTGAMESYSLSSIMARMALEMEEDGSVQDDESESSSPPRDEEMTSPQPSVYSERRLSLAEALKKGTAVSHQAAEDVHFVSNFIRGKIDRDLFARLVVQLYHVYDALEVCLDEHGPVHFGSCHFPKELARKDALLEDMDFWHGQVVEEMSEATRDYVDRLHWLAQTDPLLLLAHSYTRYMGDLSGGKILARVARKALVLGQDGLAFYEFPNITSAKRFKDLYRNAMDALPLTPEQVNKLVAEANVAFALNMRLFEELDVQANMPGASVRPLEEALEYANVSSAAVEGSQTEVKEEKCPFAKPKGDSNGDRRTVSRSSVPAKQCPWPFILMHDPKQGLRDWKTWVVLGLLLSWCWSMAVQRTALDERTD